MSDLNTKADPSASYQLLRRETATILKLGDVDALGLVEGLQLDLVSLLRLEVDGLQGQVLAGQQVDLGRLTSALTMLRQLLPTQALVASPSLPETSTRRLGSDHRAKLRALIEQTVFAPERVEAAALADAQAREERVAADEAAGVAPVPPVERRKPLSETLAPADTVVPFPAGTRAPWNNPVVRDVPHLKAASVTPSAVSEPPPQGPIPAPKGNPEGWRCGPPTEPWRPYTYWYR